MRLPLSLFGLIAIVSLLLASQAHAAGDLREAVERVRGETGGEILSAQTMSYRGDPVYRIKVLTRDGRVEVRQIAGISFDSNARSRRGSYGPRGGFFAAPLEPTDGSGLRGPRESPAPASAPMIDPRRSDSQDLDLESLEPQMRPPAAPDSSQLRGRLARERPEFERPARELEPLDRGLEPRTLPPQEEPQ